MPITLNVLRTDPAVTATAPPVNQPTIEGANNVALTAYHLDDNRSFRIGVTNVSAQTVGGLVVRWVAFQA